jgi:hypothetical protein
MPFPNLYWCNKVLVYQKKNHNHHAQNPSDGEFYNGFFFSYNSAKYDGWSCDNNCAWSGAALCLLVYFFRFRLLFPAVFFLKELHKPAPALPHEHGAHESRCD